MKHYFTEEPAHGLINPEDFEERVRMDESRITRILQKLESDHHVSVLELPLRHYDHESKTSCCKIISRRRK